MNDPPLNSRPKSWFTSAIALTLATLLISFVVGFVWLPALQSTLRLRGVWDAICTAAGLVYKTEPSDIERRSDFKTSNVVMLPTMLQNAGAVSIGRGATLALQCTICHGARGLSSADTPNLAGQYAPAIYKELRDYQSGARSSAIMVPRVSGLSEQDMRDLAAYYSYLPRLPAYHPATAGIAPSIVLSGAPMRNVAPCSACHGAVDYKTGSAWLEGESRKYLRTQLEAFASGARHNDINGQMRNVARGMSSTEIDQAAAYFSSQP
jgi:cytochrome c553